MQYLSAHGSLLDLQGVSFDFSPCHLAAVHNVVHLRKPFASGAARHPSGSPNAALSAAPATSPFLRARGAEASGQRAAERPGVHARDLLRVSEGSSGDARRRPQSVSQR